MWNVIKKHLSNGIIIIRAEETESKINWDKAESERFVCVYMTQLSVFL